MRSLGVYASAYDVHRIIRNVHAMLPSHIRRFGCVPGRLNFFEFVEMIVPKKLRAYQLLVRDSSWAHSTGNKADILDALYCLRFTTECPQCGALCHREAAWEGCPSVQCPMCGCRFECRVVASAHSRVDDPFECADSVTFSPSGLPEWEKAPLAKLFSQHHTALGEAEKVSLRLRESLCPAGGMARRRLAVRSNLVALAKDEGASPERFTLQNLCHALGSCGFTLTATEQELLMQRYDRFGLGRIDIHDLVEALAVSM